MADGATMPAVRILCAALAAVALSALPAYGEDVLLRNERNLGPEQCLGLDPAEVAVRCPGLGGRLVASGNTRYALVERYEPRRATLWCDQPDGHWRCRRVVVVDREPRGGRRRNPQAFVTAGELLRLYAGAPSLKLGDELGALFAGAERRRTCVEQPSRGCAVQAARLKVTGPGGNPLVKRRLWLVEDADGPMLQCSDAPLARCDSLDAAGWLTLLLTVRPSSQAPPAPPPELDVPEVRADKRKGLPPEPVAVAAEAVDTPAGAIEAYVRPRKAAPSLPKTPSRGDAAKLAQALDLRGKSCLAADRATVELTLTGDGNVLALAVDGAAAGAAHDCLLSTARRLPLPRFADPTWRMTAMVRKK
jgi:hypothetical protein